MRAARPLVLGWMLFALAGAARAEDEDALEQRLAVEPDVRIEIEILSGSIEVIGVDADEVRVVSEGGGVEVKGSRKRVSLRAPARSFVPWSRGVDVDLRVEVPHGARVTARTVNGPIDVEGVTGEIDLHAANGAIEVKGAPREAFLETLNSSIRFDGEGGSAVVARTLNGGIELLGVAGDVEATAVSGSIRVRGEALERAELRTMSGGIELDASLTERARVSARTYSGSVRLLLPADASARFDVQSHSGSLQTDFTTRSDEAEPSAWSRDRRGRLSFAVGEGAGRVSIESFSGSVQIEKRED